MIRTWIFGSEGLQPLWMRDQGSVVMVAWILAIAVMGLAVFGLSG